MNACERMTRGATARVRPVWLALILAFAVSPAAPPARILKVALLDASLGVNGSLDSTQGNPPAFVHFDLLEIGVGVRFSRHWGAGLGTSVWSGYFMNTTSWFPITGYAFYDLNPDARWRRPVAYGSVRFVHSEKDDWSSATIPPHVVLTAGIGYTFYAVTPHFEIGYNPYRQAVTCAAGLALPGGTYIIREPPTDRK